MITPLKSGLLGLFLFLTVIAPATAQSRFDPAIRVNDKVITQYEIEQRMLLLRALGAPGDLEQEARERLTEERLQVEAAETAGIEVTEEGLAAGIEEFAARGNLSGEQFLQFLASRGVAEQSFRDFVWAGIAWRELVRSRFAARSQVTEDEVDRAVALAGEGGGARVLLSEIILPARNPQEQARSEGLAEELSRINGYQAFAAAARNVSVSGSRDRGGRIDWLPLNRLPGPLRSQILTLAPGEVSDPVRLQNAFAVFQLRAFEELPAEPTEVAALEYAEFRIPGGSPDDARRIAGRIDTCDDLYGEARKLPEDRLVRETLPPAEIPADIRATLARLDENETSISVRRGNVQLLLMLCGRTSAAAADVDRREFRRRLVNQRIAAYAEGYLADLVADAEIVDLR